MKKVPFQKLRKAAASYGAKSFREIVFVCPMCKTPQNGLDLIAAGCPEKDVDGCIGFSCVGRFTGAGEPPPKDGIYPLTGCNWSLGGLLQMHETVIMQGGNEHPIFNIAGKRRGTLHLEAQTKKGLRK